jgi:hypothetical protein
MMNARVKARDELAAAKRTIKGWSSQEFEEMRVHLGLSHSREELLGSRSSVKAKAARGAAKKK